MSTSDPDYSQLLGNSTVIVTGNASPFGGVIDGSIGKITATADKYLLSSTIEGNFHVSANEITVGQGLSHSTVSGTLSSYNQQYRDGSHATIAGGAIALSASQTIDNSLFTDPSRFAGNDVISVDLPQTLYEEFKLATGNGDDQISLKGGGKLLSVDAGAGNDRITITSDSHAIDGGAGLDTVSLAGGRASYQIKQVGAGFTVTDGSAVVNTLVNVERITFADAAIALDTDGSGGQAYRLYQAAFNRAPDSAGLGFQMWAMDTVGWSLTQVAQGFIDSPEFVKTYGALSNHDFVVQLYANVLHRSPDDAGLKFHTDLLDAHTISRATDLVGFSESPENQAALIGVIGNGFTYTPYHG